VWEFKQIKDLYLKIVAPRNFFIEFMDKVRDAHYRIIRYSRIILEYLFSNPEFRILF